MSPINAFITAVSTYLQYTYLSTEHHDTAAAAAVIRIGVTYCIDFIIENEFKMAVERIRSSDAA
jgi:hypothetical protein